MTLAAGTPALAFEDGRGSTFDTFMNMFGMTGDKEENVIQYRERAPLVLPPKAELRQPLPPAAHRTAAWPQDQEAIRARKRAAEALVPNPSKEEVAPRVATSDLTRQGRLSPEQAQQSFNRPRECDMDPFNRSSGCSPDAYWKALSTKKSTEDKVQLRAGVEPSRDYLTQPPKGYMAPKQNVKATFEARKEEEDIRDYFRKKPTE